MFYPRDLPLEPPPQAEPKLFECEHCRRDVDSEEYVYYVDREYLCRECAIRKLGADRFYDEVEDIDMEKAGELV